MNAASSSLRTENVPLHTCRWCGQEHQLPTLRPGERAMCSRCDGLLAKRSRFHDSAPLAFTAAGLVLAIPALLLPLVTVDKLRSERVVFLFGGAEALWQDGMTLLAIWVMLCGALAPVALLATLIGLFMQARSSRNDFAPRLLARVATAVEQWAMPEVYVLAILVALTKLHALANVTVGPGLWCYTAMAFMMLLAWRSFEYGPPLPERTVVPAS